MYPDEFHVNARWWRTGDPCFPLITAVDGHWWVLRVNSFPDHALYTLFVDGGRCYDVDDVPPTWQMGSGPVGAPEQSADGPAPEEIGAALAPIRGFIAYGSEVGQPCDNPYCCG